MPGCLTRKPAAMRAFFMRHCGWLQQDEDTDTCLPTQALQANAGTGQASP